MSADTSAMPPRLGRLRLNPTNCSAKPPQPSACARPEGLSNSSGPPMVYNSVVAPVQLERCSLDPIVYGTGWSISIAEAHWQ